MASGDSHMYMFWCKTFTLHPTSSSLHWGRSKLPEHLYIGEEGNVVLSGSSI